MSAIRLTKLSASRDAADELVFRPCFLRGRRRRADFLNTGVAGGLFWDQYLAYLRHTTKNPAFGFLWGLACNFRGFRSVWPPSLIEPNPSLVKPSNKCIEPDAWRIDIRTESVP